MKAFKCAMITGASSGIGEELAYLLAEHGIALVLTGQDRDRLEKVGAKCREKVPVDLLIADLSKMVGRGAHIEKIWKKKPDLIVNNAGFGFYGDALAYPTSTMTKMLDVNGKAVMELTLEGARVMIAEKKKGVILNVSSAGAFQVFPYFAVYAATKTFVNAISEAFDYEMRPYGVRVLAACPGVVKTRFSNRAAGGKSKSEVPFKMSARFAAEQIWWQIEKEKVLHVFDWHYRLLTFFSRVMPKVLLFPSIKKVMIKRGGKRELILTPEE